MARVTYLPTQDAWDGFLPYTVALIGAQQLTRVCEIGGGANPLLSEDFIAEKRIDYTVLDCSRAELDKAPDAYRKVEADITSRDLSLPETYDLMLSRMLAEHVADPRQFHDNVYRHLSPGGYALHFFPTLFTTPFIINALVPERLANWLLDIVAPRDRVRHEKFPAFYRWCRGPTKAQFQRFARMGFDVVEYRGFFGHGAYYRRLPPIRRLHRAKTAFLLEHPLPALTSYAYVLLRKPPHPSIDVRS